MTDPAVAIETLMPPSLQRPFRAIIFDWDGTAVTDRREDATPLVHITEPLLDLGIWLVIVTGTNFGNINQQFCQLIREEKRSHLLVCANRGSEVYGFTAQGSPLRVWLRTATTDENKRLDAVAIALRDTLAARTGLDVHIIFGRMNRRKVDLIPLPEWADPPKSQIGTLLQAVQSRLHAAGQPGGLASVIDEARLLATSMGLPDARITTDVKHIEIGLTDKHDALLWLKSELLAPEKIPLDYVLIVGDEFGSLGGFPGSDDRMRVDVEEACIVSVGAEPEGTPPPVMHLGGGPSFFRQLLSFQIAQHTQEQYKASTVSPTHAGPMAQNTDDPVNPHAWTQILFTSTVEPNWRIDAPTFIPALEHDIETRFAISNGFLGIRGALDMPSRASRPRTFVAGLFASGGKAFFNLPVLAPLPDWMTIKISVDGKRIIQNSHGIEWHRRFLDMRRGIVITEWSQRVAGAHLLRFRTARFASRATPNIAFHLTQVALMSQSSPVEIALQGAPSLRTPSSKNGTKNETQATDTSNDRGKNGQNDDNLDTQNNTLLVPVPGNKHVATLTGGSANWIDGKPAPLTEGDALTPVWLWQGKPNQWATFARALAVTVGSAAEAAQNQATMALWRSWREPPATLVSSHVSAWAERWEASDIVIEGDDEAQLALRFAMYHLISSADPTRDDVSIGARGLTGDAYLGHVFWDTDIFALPFYIFTWPDAARALLRYRYKTLPAARAKAARLGYRGALYAWESADTGDEVTPPLIRRPDGAVLRVLSGEEEHHISADIAFAVWSYWQVTEDDQFFIEAGAEILLETARFWASRCTGAADGQQHIYDVIGPDEYHDTVDDNAYTNELARWNLKCAAKTATILSSRWPDHWRDLAERLNISDAERAAWDTSARLLAQPHTTDHGVIEQFAGYFEREDITPRTHAPGDMPIDMLLGSDRVAGSQIIKQADVLMLFALLGEQYSAQEWAANFAYYAPRCAHGSSLSPAVHAGIAARVGDMTAAESYLRQAMQIDLSNTLGASAQGIHIGALGGLWNAVVFGFLGLAFTHGSLRIHPKLPPAWQHLQIPLRWRDRRITVDVTQQPLKVQIRLDDGEPCTIIVGELPLALTTQHAVQALSQDGGGTWNEVTP